MCWAVDVLLMYYISLNNLSTSGKSVAVLCVLLFRAVWVTWVDAPLEIENVHISAGRPGLHIE